MTVLPMDEYPPLPRYSRARCKMAMESCQTLVIEYAADDFTRDYWRGIERVWKLRWDRGYD